MSNRTTMQPGRGDGRSGNYTATAFPFGLRISPAFTTPDCIRPVGFYNVGVVLGPLFALRIILLMHGKQ
jgi:hypothetical protein